MGNDSSEYWAEVAQEVYDEAEADNTFTREERAALDLAERMKSDHEEAAEQFMGNQASFFADIFNAALSSVNWDEIARHYIDDCDKETEEAA